MRREYLCHANEVPSGTVHAVTVGRISYAVVRKGERFSALRNICPHQGAELSRGRLCGTSVPSLVGEFVYGRDGEILRCPWHSHEFDIWTGLSLHDPEKERVKVYPVVREGDSLFLELTG